MSIPAMLFWLLVGHAIGDYPLQVDFLAKGKNRRHPLPGVPWYQCLAAHALIQGGVVAFVTGQIGLGIAEAIVHCVIDDMKCNGAFGDGARAFNIDQACHVAFKLVWLGCIMAVAR